MIDTWVHNSEPIFRRQKKCKVNLLKSALLAIVLCISNIGISQISFIEHLQLENELREVRGAVELPNGNYCVIVIEDDVFIENSRIQGVYLFDQCGKYIDKIQFLNTDEFVEFQSVDLFQGKILLHGFILDGLFGDYLLMLNPEDLTIHKEQIHPELDARFHSINNWTDSIGYLDTHNRSLSYSMFDSELNSLDHMEVDLLDEDLKFITFEKATKNHIIYTKHFYDDYQEIGIANYSLNEISTIKGSSVHGKIRFSAHKFFLNDSTFYTTISYALDEGLYYRKYILDSLVSEVPIDQNSKLKSVIYYEVDGNQLKVLGSDGLYRIHDIETAELISERPLLENISVLSPKKIKTNDNGIILIDDHWTYIDYVWQSYIRLIKLNEDWELDIETPSPCIVSTYETPQDKTSFSINGNPNPGSFTLESNEPIKTVLLYDANGRIIRFTTTNVDTNTIQISTEYKGMVLVSAITHSGIRISKKVIIY